jgi:hypothetical protein
MERSVLAELERAELASRARRLAAEADADDRLAAARREAGRIVAATPVEAERAVAALRARHGAASDAAIDAIDGELARLESSVSAPGESGDPRFEATVELVVAAVLGEPEA